MAPSPSRAPSSPQAPSVPGTAGDDAAATAPANGEELLVRRAQDGDEEAFRTLVERHGRRLFRVAYRICGDAETAEDAVQEAFLSAYRTLDRFDGRARFGTWLHRIAVNAAIDLLRKRRRSASRLESPEGGEPTLPTSEPGPERRARSREVSDATRVALRTLSPMERTAFVLRHFEGRSIAEICQLLGLRESAGKQAVFRAVRKLRKALTPFVLPGGETT